MPNTPPRFGADDEPGNDPVQATSTGGKIGAIFCVAANFSVLMLEAVRWKMFEGSSSLVLSLTSPDFHRERVFDNTEDSKNEPTCDWSDCVTRRFSGLPGASWRHAR
jgi:hypothetical protein